jgi:hypothetical protein
MKEIMRIDMKHQKLSVVDDEFVSIKIGSQIGGGNKSKQTQPKNK